MNAKSKIMVSLLTLPALLFAPPAASADPPVPQAPPEARILKEAGDEYVQDDGLRVRWASVVYQLSTGHEAEVYVEVDGRQRGDGYIFVEGEIAVHVTYNAEARGGTSTWIAPELELPQAALAELAQAGVGETLFAALGGGPQETKCSEFGKGVVKAAKYIWIGLTLGAGGACCMATAPSGVGCMLCTAGAGLAAEAGGELADGYCD